jgi:hypothetical protein
MGTAFAAATRETGGELQLISRMGCDATTFGNHDFDLGPDGTAQTNAVAAKAGRLPAVVASNTTFTESDPTLAGLKRLANVNALPFAKICAKERGSQCRSGQNTSAPVLTGRCTT